MRLLSAGPVGAEEPFALIDDAGSAGPLRPEAVVVPLRPLAARHGVRIRHLSELLDSLPGLARWLDERHARDLREPLGNRRIGAPIPTPRLIVGVGMNYPAHAAGLDARAGDPVLFLKPPSAVCGPYDAIVRPPETTALDHEVELGIVIGAAAHRVPPERALERVAGFVVADDVSARDIALGAGLAHPLSLQLTRAKGFPTFCPLGPWLLTVDETTDPADLLLRLSVNGSARQQARAAEMITGVAELVAFVSAGFPLEPGDVILSGSPAGCGFEQDPPVFLRPGDVVDAEITGLGRMRTPVVDEMDPSAHDHPTPLPRRNP
ncbi:fumarylacetoacetate hydrolase family protein [Microbacterium azadirachtae]|uniref:Ureidoglycolate lyase n=1 Tax=Microbacterium azadirachtae TaxID=582680 RepID=A0A0F0LSQ1_9MICO|nr:fumarylacetoacetate hydrolase family protein [Microbacterium azadirachtae]KJL34541.1 Ureidoglycolate lyase [Microbacterium azadirachtae]